MPRVMEVRLWGFGATGLQAGAAGLFVPIGVESSEPCSHVQMVGC